jgi:hypothetical protein
VMRGCKRETFNGYLLDLSDWNRIFVEEIETTHGTMKRLWTVKGYEAQQQENERLLLQKEKETASVTSLDAYNTSKE